MPTKTENRLDAQVGARAMYANGVEGRPAADDNTRVPADGPTPGGPRHASVEPLYIKKSRQSRRILTVAIIVLVMCLFSGCVLFFRYFTTSQLSAQREAQSLQATEQMDSTGSLLDASATSSKTVTVPNLVGLLGLNAQEVIEDLQDAGYEAQISTTTSVNADEASDITQEVHITLDLDPSKTRIEIPSVYLFLDSDGDAVECGYSVATNELGYGTLSFSDAILNNQILENTFSEAGISIDPNDVVLPQDASEYSEYEDDGRTLSRESCDFSGTCEDAGGSYAWRATLSYDYSTYNITDNLSDTIRIIYIYVSYADDTVADEGTAATAQGQDAAGATGDAVPAAPAEETETAPTQ